MKKLLIILLSALSLAIEAQEKKTIALLDPRIDNGSTPVATMEKNMVRGELRKAIVNFPGYDALTRSDIDQMMKEQNFQRSGLVSDSQIKKLGEMSGADYICVSTISKTRNEFYIEAYLIHVESGRMSNPASQYGELYEGNMENMYRACKSLAAELLSGADDNEKSTECNERLYDLLRHPEEVELYTTSPSWARYTSVAEDCMTTISLMHECVRNRMYADAYEFWKDAYYKCPNANKAIYTDGEQILTWLYNNATTEKERENILKQLLQIYDKRIFFFGDDTKYPLSYILGKKGVTLYSYAPQTEENYILSYLLLKEAVYGLQNQCGVVLLTTFYDISAYIYKNCPLHSSAFQQDYNKVKSCIIHNTTSNQNIKNSALHKIEKNYNRLMNKSGYYASVDYEIVQQKTEEFEEEEEVVFMVVEEMPEFPCGQDSLLRYLNANVKYPVIAQENGIQGRVICQFVVNKDGSIVDVEVVRSGGDPSLDKEAIRVVKSMPKWKPGTQRGKPVRVKYTVPINFNLQ